MQTHTNPVTPARQHSITPEITEALKTLHTVIRSLEREGN